MADKETSLIAGRAAVYKHDPIANSWASADSGLSRVDVYQHPTLGTYRVVGVDSRTKEFSINSAIFAQLVYQKASPIFHQWTDLQKDSWGLNFASPEEADSFASVVQNCVIQLEQAPRARVAAPSVAAPKSAGMGGAGMGGAGMGGGGMGGGGMGGSGMGGSGMGGGMGGSGGSSTGGMGGNSMSSAASNPMMSTVGPNPGAPGTRGPPPFAAKQPPVAGGGPTPFGGSRGPRGGPPVPGGGPPGGSAPGPSVAGPRPTYGSEAAPAATEDYNNYGNDPAPAMASFNNELFSKIQARTASPAPASNPAPAPAPAYGGGSAPSPYGGASAPSAYGGGPAKTTPGGGGVRFGTNTEAEIPADTSGPGTPFQDRTKRSSAGYTKAPISAPSRFDSNPSPAPTQTPTPTPQVEEDKSKLFKGSHTASTPSVATPAVTPAVTPASTGTPVTREDLDELKKEIFAYIDQAKRDIIAQVVASLTQGYTG